MPPDKRSLDFDPSARDASDPVPPARVHIDESGHRAPASSTADASASQGARVQQA